MKLHLLVFWIACLPLTSVAEAQSYLWFEPQVAVEKTENRVETGEYFGNLSFGHQWKPALGIWFQSAHGNFWGETAVGPSFSLTPELQVGIGIGIEHFEPKPLRLRLNAYYDAPGGSFFYIQYDRGKNSNWIWADGTRMRGKFGLGVVLQMPDAGVGPKIEIRTSKYLGLWVAPVYNWQAKKTRVLLGGRLMFD